MKTINAGLILLLFLSGCATQPMATQPMATQRGMDQMMATWQNKNINDFITRGGPPNQVYDMPNGDKMYVFSRSSTITMPVYQPPTYIMPSPYEGGYASAARALSDQQARMYSGQTFTESCTIRLRVDSTQTIIGYSYEGNGCRVPERQ